MTEKDNECCYIYALPLIGQRLKIRCPRNAVWHIEDEGPKIPLPEGSYTESCDKHVSELFDHPDSSTVHHVWEIEK